MTVDDPRPRPGDRALLPVTVVELRTVGGVPGALVDPGHPGGPVWVPLARLIRQEDAR